MQRRAFLKTSVLSALVLALPSLAKSNKGAKMKVAVLAASGRSGKAITKEAVAAGFEVTAFVRNAAKAQDLGAKVVEKDIFALTAADLQGFDAIVDAFGVWDDLSLHKKHGEYLIKILQGNKAKFYVVGGAGSLYMDKTHTTRLMDTPSFPDSYKGVANATADVLNLLRAEKNIDWIYVCPAAVFDADGAKTGKFKIIGEEFEVNARGESKVSYADYALAMIELIKGGAKYSKVRVGVIGL